MFDIGGAEFFRRHIHVYIMCAHACFLTCVKAQRKFLKLKFVLEPNFFAKMARMWIKKSIFTVKIPLMLQHWGGRAPPLAPPVPTLVQKPGSRLNFHHATIHCKTTK